MYSQYKKQNAIGLLRETVSQTAGPYVHIGLAQAIAGNPEREDEIWNILATKNAKGQHINLKGFVFDGNGDSVKDALIEIWQADCDGKFHTEFDNDADFRSFGRSACAIDGEYFFQTVKPGKILNEKQQTIAPHINIAIFARGINIQLQTKVFFSDEEKTNLICPIFNCVESIERRKTLIAIKEDENNYRFDIYIQGDKETVFFDF